jgi:ABC-2 type transport system permease protein
MKKALVLSKIYINSLYGISRLISDLKTDRKAALKSLGILILILFGLSGTATMFVAFNLELYKALEPLGQQGIVINSSIMFAMVFTLIFGFVGIVATYFIQKEADIILSMPFEHWNILFAKFATSYIMEFLITLAIMGTGVIVYGIKSGAGVVFYVMYLVTAILLPFIPLVLSYFVIIPAMKVGSIFKKKDATMIITSFLAMIFIVGFQSFFQKTMLSLQGNPKLLQETFTSPDGLVSLLGRVYPPASWGTYAIIDVTSGKGALGLALLIITALIAVIALHFIMSGVYVQSIIGSGEVKKSTKKYNEKEFKGNLRGKSKLYSMVVREIRLMNREPVFFLNGPFIVILLPLIFGFMFFIQGGEVFKLLDKMLTINNFTYYATLAIGGLGAMLGGMSNIAPTGTSREGKAFMFLKSMPIDPIQYVNSKLIHSMIFGVFGGVVACVIGSFIPGIGLGNLLLAFVISQLLMFPGFILGVLLDLTWPKLIWDNPQKAIKQNVNAVLMVFGNMFVLYFLAFMIYAFLKNPLTGYITLTLVPAIIGGSLYAFLLKYAPQKFYEIEI